MENIELLLLKSFSQGTFTALIFIVTSKQISKHRTYLSQTKAEDKVKKGGRQRAAEAGGAGDHADGESGEEAARDDLVELDADDHAEEARELCRSMYGEACGEIKKEEGT